MLGATDDVLSAHRQSVIRLRTVRTFERSPIQVRPQPPTTEQVTAMGKEFQWFLRVAIVLLLDSAIQCAMVRAGHPSYRQQRCSNRLESALQQMRRRNQVIQVERGRSMQPQSPYSLYYSLYGQHDEEDDVDQFYSGGNRGYYGKHIHRSDRYRGPSDQPEAPPSGPSSIASSLDFYPYSGAASQPAGPSSGAGSGPSAPSSNRQPHKLHVSGIEVEELRVRLPPQKASARWVEVDKCKFIMENSTLDTRLIFPDLTLSGKIVLQPTGGRCNMILRLRHAGIEFHTMPIGFDAAAPNDESRRSAAASVRTDSHFAEPGFISVFAHGCEGPTGIRLRQNSKRRFGFAGEHMPDRGPVNPDIGISEPQVVLGTSQLHRWGKLQNPFHHKNPSGHRGGPPETQPSSSPPPYDIRSEGKFRDGPPLEPQDTWNYFVPPEGDDFYDMNRAFDHQRYKRQASGPRRQRDGRSFMRRGPPLYDQMHFDDDILNISDNLDDLIAPDARAFAGAFRSGEDRDEMVGDALSMELEKLFSMGVRGLLTTYMQRALQPAIKETLMENMGYTVSYG